MTATTHVPRDVQAIRAALFLADWGLYALAMTVAFAVAGWRGCICVGIGMLYQAVSRSLVQLRSMIRAALRGTS